MKRLLRSRLAAWTALATAAIAVAAAPAASAEDVTNRTVFGSSGDSIETLRLYRFTLNAAGDAIARTAVQSGQRSVAVDAADGRMVFMKRGAETVDNELWLREPNGVSRFLTKGTEATFTPGRTALFFTRRVKDANAEIEGPFAVHDELWMYYFADGRKRKLSSLPDSTAVLDPRYAKDGKRVYMTTYTPGSGFPRFVAYGPGERAIVQTYENPDPALDCGSPELLPSGLRALTICPGEEGPELWTIRLSDGEITNRAPLPDGVGFQIRGRLSANTLLISGRLQSGSTTTSLGALDLATMTFRPLANTAGHHTGVAPW